MSTYHKTLILSFNHSSIVKPRPCTMEPNNTKQWGWTCSRKQWESLMEFQLKAHSASPCLCLFRGLFKSTWPHAGYKSS